ncbi:MAG: dihydropteroate synthase [Thermodesulfobacteriota bacterium]|nr:dihydropteroate synthase [Thermodesulfobacteriota bacterium]
MAFVLKWANYVLNVSQRTHVMGILNVTPDSFSDGGRYLELDKAVEHAIDMVLKGADIIDVGGESTRPYANEVSGNEEMDRVIPVIEALRKETSVPISIDTYKGEVAREALKSGASMINDISALRFDADMAAIAAEAGVPVILMHMRGRPGNMQDKPLYEDLILEILSFLKDAVGRALNAGVREDLIIVDPGIGFGKAFDDNLQIIKELSQLALLGRPVLLGLSNKGFIGHVLGKEIHERGMGNMAATACGVMNGAHIVRAHDVKNAAETVKMVDAIIRGSVEK